MSMSRSHSSSTPDPFISQAENLILPDGAVSERTAELLAGLTGEHGHEAEVDHHPQLDADAAYHLRKERTKHLPWWKRPSPWWLIGIMPLSSIAVSASFAPRIEIYTLLVCSVHKPDIFQKTFPELVGGTYPQFHSTAIESIMTPRSTGIHSNTLPRVDEVILRLPGVDLLDDRPPSDEKPPTCASDPVVQTEVAKLTVVISTSMGILSCLTTGWWGAFSDRHGRTRLLGISIFGILFTDWNFILVALNFRRLPGGYWFLVLGPIVEGFLGGFTAETAATHAYIADTTSEATRSRLFSLSLGLMFTGLAFGPTLGSLLIRATGSTLSVFYAAATMHLCYALIVWFFVPESLLDQQMRQSQIKYDEELRQDLDVDPRGFLAKAKRSLAFLSPLTIFFPEAKRETVGSNPLKRKKMDWSLTWIAAAYGLSITIAGSYSYKFQYAAATFGWGSETLGYWITLVGTARAIFLAVILPVIIQVLKPHPITIESLRPGSADVVPNNSRTPEEQPLLLGSPNTGGSVACRRPVSPQVNPQKPHKKEIHSPAFDMALARWSLFIDVVSYAMMALVPTAPAFTTSSLIGSFGAGFGPAVQSVALTLYMHRGGTESGRLFGALSVVQALCSQILGPTMYGLVYMKTVATFPRTIFFVTMVTIVVSFLFLTLVRVPSAKELLKLSEHEDVEAGGRGPGDSERVGTEATNL